MVFPDLRLGRGRLSDGSEHHRSAALKRAQCAALAILALLAPSLANAGTVVQGNFGRSPAFPSTPNGRFPQETAQIIQFKQAKQIQAKNPSMTKEQARALAGTGVGVSALAMVGMGESAAQQSQILTVGGSAIASAGMIMCYTGYGCAVGGPMMVAGTIAGLGGQLLCLVRDCSIKVRSDGTVDGARIEGDKVRTTDPKPVSDSGFYPSVNEAYASEGGYNAIYTRFGVGKEFIVKDTQGYYRKGILIAYTASDGTLLRSIFGDMATTSYYGDPKPNAARSATTLGFCYTGAPCVGTSTYQSIGTATNCTGFVACYMYITSFTAGAPNGLVLTEYVPVQKMPFTQLGAGAELPPETAALPVAEGLMAQIANDVWRRQGAQAPYPYSDAEAVTPQDVADYRAEFPDRASSLADMARPISAPGQPPAIGPIASPVSPPQQVEVTNPGAAAGTNPNGDPSNGTVKEPEPDTELDDNDSLLGDIMQPARDFLAGPFKAFMTPGVALPATQCPAFTIDLPDLLGYRSQSRPVSSAFLCDWFTQQRPLIVGILHLIYSFGALIIVFKRS